jgi:hypothetical protein
MVHSYASVEKKYGGDTLRFECTMCICSKDQGCSEDRSNTVSPVLHVRVLPTSVCQYFKAELLSITILSHAYKETKN